MRRRVNQFLALAGLTALETIRQPICLILMVSALAFIGILPLILTHTLGEGAKLIRDSALAIHLLSGLILGSYAACATLTHEIRRGTAAAVLTKPVSRDVFFLAKYAGVALVVAAYSAVTTLATLLSVRTVNDPYTVDWVSAGALLGAIVLAAVISGIVNFWLRKPFASTAFVNLAALVALTFVAVNLVDATGARAPFGSLLTWGLVPVSILVAMAILVLAAISVSLATRLDVVATLSICTFILLLGFMSDYLVGRLAAEHPFAAALYTAIPNWQQFWAADILSGPATLPQGYLAGTGLYALFYLAAVLCLGMVAFRHMEIRS
jgi:ABC-type transport system involved in multi-copper enzyme maturation permease subunit